MRDYKKLTAFQLADALVLEVYRATSKFPSDERYGLSSQLKRASVSVCANLVEGSKRRTEKDFVRFLEIAFGSAAEVHYLLTVAHRVGMPDVEGLLPKSDEVVRTLGGLVSHYET